MATYVVNNDDQAGRLLVLDTMVQLLPLLLAQSCLLVCLEGDGIPSNGRRVGHGLVDFR